MVWIGAMAVFAFDFVGEDVGGGGETSVEPLPPFEPLSEMGIENRRATLRLSSFGFFFS